MATLTVRETANGMTQYIVSNGFANNDRDLLTVNNAGNGTWSPNAHGHNQGNFTQLRDAVNSALAEKPFESRNGMRIYQVEDNFIEEIHKELQRASA